MCFWIGAYQLYPFLIMEASVKGDSKCVSHTLCCHFYTHKLLSRNRVSDLPFEVREELMSLMLSASNSLPFVCLVLSLRKKG